ncbi:MAG: isoprenylcysteine carboxylmethyltransferase family protein [Burkholderiales bacterium]|nr:isoprenylcysteine carboxylmethyltransferase family protein [Burkholderiales bacterium]
MPTVLDTKIPPPVVAAAAAAAIWVVAPVGLALPLGAEVRAGLALAIAAVGLAFDLSAIVAFVRARTTINPMTPDRTTALVTGGVYRITRNPMYVGLALLLTAWAVYRGAWIGLVGPVVFVAYITRFQIVPEERAMARRFGDEWHTWSRRVRRWL